MSRIVLLTAGSRGDVDPYIALGAGLRQDGHTVRIAAHEGFRALVEEQGLAFAPVVLPSRALTSSALWQQWQRSAGNVAAYVFYFRQIARRARELIKRMANDFWEACQDSELVVSSTSAIGGPEMAAHLGVPHVWALFQPMSPTRTRPHFMTPRGMDLGPWLNRWTYRVAERIYWLLFGPALRQWLRETLGHGWRRNEARGIFLNERSGAVLYGFSEHVFPRPADWGAEIEICGFWHLQAAPAWQPESELVAFLEAGPQPVYFYLSGMKFEPWEEMLSMAVAALAQCGQRGLFYTGVRQASIELPPFILRVGPVPHSWLLPRVAAVVHHGGAGTTASAWQAGTPAVTIPGFWDQPFWGRCVQALETGPPPMALRSLNTERLAEAVQMVVGEGPFRRNAATLGAKLRGEDGVRKAACTMNRLLEGMKS